MELAAELPMPVPPWATSIGERQPIVKTPALVIGLPLTANSELMLRSTDVTVPAPPPAAATGVARKVPVPSRYVEVKFVSGMLVNGAVELGPACRIEFAANEPMPVPPSATGIATPLKSNERLPDEVTGGPVINGAGPTRPTEVTPLPPPDGPAAPPAPWITPLSATRVPPV